MAIHRVCEDHLVLAIPTHELGNLQLALLHAYVVLKPALNQDAASIEKLLHATGYTKELP